MIDDFVGMFERQDEAEARLVQAFGTQPLACSLVMAALCWDRVDRRGWHTAAGLGAQARRLLAVWGVSAAAVGDADQVSAALEWATRDPALLESDGQGGYRAVSGVVFPAGSRFWQERHRAAVISGVLTPLELVIKGDNDRGGKPADPEAAEASYQRAVDSDDPDAAAMGSLRLAEFAEERDQPAEATRRYTEVAALQHPIASPPAVVWLARQATQDGDRARARVLARQVLGCADESLQAEAWGILGTLAWIDEDPEEAVAALRKAVHAAGTWHWAYSRRLAEVLAASGDPAGAADVYVTLLDQPLFHAPDAGRYVQLMTVAGRGDEAVTVLEEHATEGGHFTGDLLLALASAHAARDDLDATRRTLARVRAHWSAVLPQVSVRADVIEASVAAADGDDDRAAELFRSLTDTDDTERRELARPLLIAAGDHFAAEHKLCLIPGVRPLLEYLCEVAGSDTAVWAATSLAHLAIVEDRPDDAEAAVLLAARHLSPEEVTVLRALMMDRVGRGREGLACLIDAAVVATPQALVGLLPSMTVLGMRGVWLDISQRPRLRAAVDHALFATEDDDVRNRIAMAMAQLELYSCFDPDRATQLWHLVADSDDPAVAGLAWLNVGLMRQHSAPITAAHAFEQAILVGDTAVGARAAMELARLAERLGDNMVLERACVQALDLADGDDWAQAALRLGRLNQYNHPDDAENAYHAAIAEPGARPATIGAALARLGALYALHGNRRLAQRIWRRGKRHRDPHIAEAFAVERARIGRVTRRVR